MNAYTRDRLNVSLANKGELWVPAKEIMQVTGWDAKYMKRARKYGFVEFKGDRKTGIKYNPHSVPQELIKAPK